MKRKMLKRLTALALSAFLILSTAPGAFAEGTITVTLDKAELSLTEGEQATLSVSVQNGETEVENPTVTYESSNPAAATVDSSSGVVTAVAAGTAVITATYQNGESTHSDTCTVTVTARVPVTKVEITDVAIEPIDVGARTKALIAVITPSNATDQAVTWKSSDVTVATVDQSGIVKGVAPGEVKITAVADGISSEGRTVTVSGVKMAETLSLRVGRSETLVCARFGNASSTVTWTSSNISVASVKEGKVSAYNPGTATITATSGKYSATCTVTVEEDVASAINASMTVGEAFSFGKIISDLNDRAVEQIEAGLDYVTGLTVSTGQGVLYYGYSSPDVPGSGVGGTQSYYISPNSTQKALSDVVFVPAPDFSGTAVISYTGSGSGMTFNGSIRISVANSGDVAYNTAEERLIPFSADDFSTVCRAKTGRTLRYVTFEQPAESKGTLYYNYSTVGQYSQRVSAGTKYYVSGGSLLLENVSFLPAQGYTGTLTIPYYGTDSAGATYTGKITITVYPLGNTGSNGIEYHATAGKAVSFNRADFRTICVGLYGYSLDYVYFTLPGASQGTLYYKYVSSTDYDSKVSAGTRYFYSKSPLISNVSFVPSAGASGTVTIPYTGYDTAGNRFEGNVIVRIDGRDGTIRYTAKPGEEVEFDALDFNEACQEINGASVSSVGFELPPSSQGTLYRYYSSSSTSRTTVTEGTRYGKSTLSNIVFVPKSSFSGVVTIPFSGVDTNGYRFTGTVQITVSELAGTTTEMLYYFGSSLPARFEVEYFRGEYADALPYPLFYISFRSLPSAAYGKLMLNYRGPGTGTEVSAGTRYYNNGSQAISDLCFIPKAGFQGSVTIPYSAVDIQGNSANGLLRITISDNYLTRHFNDTSGYSWAEPSIEFLYDCGVTKGMGDGSYGSASNISRGDFVLMLDRLFDFTQQPGTNFKDVPAGSYYAQAIMTAKALGIATGDENGRFKPDSAITRQDVALMLYTAMKCAGWDVTSADLSVLNAYPDGGAVAENARTAMAAMVTMGIFRGDESGKLNPEASITRAELAVVLHRLLTR